MEERYVSLVGIIDAWCKDRAKADDVASYLVDKLYSGSTSVDRVIVQGATAMHEWCKALIYSSIHGSNEFTRTRWDEASRNSRNGGSKPGRAASLDASDVDRLGQGSKPQRDLIENLSEEPKPEFFFESFLSHELHELGLSEEDIDRRLRLQKAISMLSPWQFQLYRLYYEQRKTHRQIASEKGIPQTNVYWMLVDLRESLERMLGTRVTRKYLY